MSHVPDTEARWWLDDLVAVIPEDKSYNSAVHLECVAFFVEVEPHQLPALPQEAVEEVRSYGNKYLAELTSSQGLYFSLRMRYK